MARRANPSVFSALALLAAACAPREVVVSEGLTLTVEPSAAVVGDRLKLSFIQDGRRVEVSEALYEAIRAEPPGILERASSSELVAIAAGRTTLKLEASGGIVLTHAVDVSCPSVGDAVVVHRDEVIDVSANWSAGEGTHRVEGTLRIDGGGSLTIGACASIEMAAGSMIVVGEGSPGRLVVRGSREQPVRFFGEGWRGIRLFAAHSAGSVLRGMRLEGATGLDAIGGEPGRAVVDVIGDPNVYYPSSDRQPVPFTLEAVEIVRCADIGFRLRSLNVMAAVAWRDNKVDGCGGPPVSVDAASLGATPRGSYPAGTDVEVIGGWAGANYQYWADIGVPYRVKKSIVIAASQSDDGPPASKLIGGIFVYIAGGAEFRFEQDAGLIVGTDYRELAVCSSDEECSEGWVCELAIQRCTNPDAPPVRLAVRGSPTEPVRFTSARESPAPGDWPGIVFMRNATLRLGGRIQEYMGGFRGALIEYAGAPNGLMGLSPDVPAAITVLSELSYLGSHTSFWLLDGSVVRYNRGYGLYSPRSAVSLDAFRTLRWGVPPCFCGNDCDVVTELPEPGFAGPCVTTSTNECPCSFQGFEYPL